MRSGSGQTKTLLMVKEAELLWQTWNIRICILASFFIQGLLTFGAMWRKSRSGLGLLIWLLYLSADAIALYTIGLITNTQGSSLSSSSSSSKSIELLVFWAPFLLVHLGGPDTITSLALEDNELWLRHLLQFCTQIFGTTYLFVRTSQTLLLRIATVLMFLVGCFKYTERTASQYTASMDSFRESLQSHPNPGPNYATLMEEYTSMKEANIPVHIISSLDEEKAEEKEDRKIATDDYGSQRVLISDPGSESVQIDDPISNESKINEIELVNKAYNFYNRFKGLIVDILLTHVDRDDSRRFFLDKNITAEQAFKVIQIELNFIYDTFYTKVNLLWKEHRVSRIISVVFLVASILVFYMEDKRHYLAVDVRISYVLLGGAAFMDVVAFLMYILSDWFVVDPSTGQKKQRLTALLKWLFKYRLPMWSGKMSQYDLLNYCLNTDQHSPNSWTYLVLPIIRRLEIAIRHALNVYESNFSKELMDAIFEELRAKARKAKTAKDGKVVCEARGNLVFSETKYMEYAKNLRAWTTGVDYDQSLLLWHITTDLCLPTDPKIYSSSTKELSELRMHSKKLSDYMMYLFIMQPSMTSMVAGIAQVRFEDTCAETRKFILRKQLRKRTKIEAFKRLLIVRSLWKAFKWVLSGFKTLFSCCIGRDQTSSNLKPLHNPKVGQLCDEIVEVKAEWNPEKVKGDSSKSVLFEARRLNQALNQIPEADRWEVIFKVWVELLCYAACRCPPTAHVQQLRRGGQLITLVWLLMAHLGFGEQFRINQGTGWAKLVVQDPFTKK